jgi:hypothetical protein
VAIRTRVRGTPTPAGATPFFGRFSGALVSFALACAPAVISCGELPDTTAPLPKARGGSGGASAGDAGTNSKGGSSSGTGGKSEGSGGSGAGSSGQAGSGGKAASGGSGAEAGADPGSGGADDGGADNGGSASSGRGGSGGGGGALGGAGSGGSSGKGGAGSGGSVTNEFFGDARCSSDFELCEDFESGSLDTGRWSTRTSGGANPEVDDTRAARGEHSLHVHTEDNGFAYISQTDTFPAADNTYYARMFVYFEALPTAPQWAHWSLSVGLEDGNESEARIGGQFDGDINRFGVGSDHGPTGDWTQLDEDDPNEVPEGEWICLEWLNQGDTDEGRVWINDEEHPSLHTTATEHGGDGEYLLPEFDSVWFGWWHYQGDTDPPEFDLWIDEIVVDDERIGCAN